MTQTRARTALESQLDEYLFHLAFERGLSERTVTSYRADLVTHVSTLAEWEIDDPKSVTTEILREYLARLHDLGRAPRSRQRARSALRGFYGHLLSKGEVEFDASNELEGPKSAKTLPKVLPLEDVESLLATTQGATPLPLRDRALLELGYGAGLRASELIGLGSEDFDLHDRWVRVRGKGSKERVVPLGKKAADAVATYLNEGRPRLLGTRRDPGRIFLNARGGALTRMGFWKILQKRALEAGLERKRVHPHVLRHSFATHLLHGGASLRVVQELLGHSNLKTTEIYTAVDRAYLQRMHHEFHPRG